MTRETTSRIPHPGRGIFGRRRQRGSALLEAIFVVPVMLFLLLMIVDLGRLVYTKNALQDATQTAVRAASQRGGTVINGTKVAQIAFEQALAATPGVNAANAKLTSLQPNGVCTNTSAGRTIRIRSQYTFRFNTPGLNAMLGFMAPAGQTAGSATTTITAGSALRCEIIW